jgi:hypothetical protein
VLVVGIGAVAFGSVLAAAGLLAIRSSGAEMRLARRFAGARSYRVADVLRLAAPPGRPVRVAGRIRCPDPIRTSGGERLVLLHRDVEVRVPGIGWVLVERLRQARAFDLWDHAGAVPVAPDVVAEPLIVIPDRWHGQPAELPAELVPAVREVAGHRAAEPDAARAETRRVSVVDRLELLAEVDRDGQGATSLRPPRGGLVVSNLELDAAMRLLGGPRRRRLLAGSAAVAIGLVLIVAGAVLAIAGGLTANVQLGG